MNRLGNENEKLRDSPRVNGLLATKRFRIAAHPEEFSIQFVFAVPFQRNRQSRFHARCDRCRSGHAMVDAFSAVIIDAAVHGDGLFAHISNTH
jgi:hypothetical protein